MFGLFKKASPTQLSTQLLAACKAGQLEEVKKIITKGVDVGRRDDHGKTALMYAAETVTPRS